VKTELGFIEQFILRVLKEAWGWIDWFLSTPPPNMERSDFK